MRKKVYIANDDIEFIELISDFLDDIGYEVNGSSELLDLLLLDTINLPDVFMLNVQMWGEDSEMISCYLKSNKPTDAIPVILFSTQKRSEQNTYNRFADGFISIPFEIEELPGLLENLRPF